MVVVLLQVLPAVHRHVRHVSPVQWVTSVERFVHSI